MKAWLIDAYRSKNKIVLWLKDKDKDIRLERDFQTEIYLHPSGEWILKMHDVPYCVKRKKSYLRKQKTVLAIPIDKLNFFESLVRDIEQAARYRIPMYNADIPPEQLYLYKNDLAPCTLVEIKDDTIRTVDGQASIPLVKISLEIISEGDIRAEPDTPIESIKMDNKLIAGLETEVLDRFVREFKALDPDVIVMDYAFFKLPYLVSRLEANGFHCPFHRWDDKPIRYKGGKSFFSYGQVHYRDFAIRLNGRFLVDANTVVGNECEIDGIVELCQLTGARFQQIASRSFGAAFQGALVREMIRHGFLVPYKEKPVEQPMNMLQLLKSDRVGHTFDPWMGFHRDVAEIDFSSMYPWIIYNHNISADTILCHEGPFEKAPGIPVTISLKHKGLVPLAIKPLLDRRMYYKKHPTRINKQRAKGLKWVLVTSYGYLRFREFKMGIPSSHMAIGAYAREIIISAARLAEEHGFEVVHGIIDSLYIKKKGITKKEVRLFCHELEIACGIPISLEGIFRWIVFLPSVQDKQRPVPTKYFGVFKSGDIKARGIEVRQRSAPLVVQLFQQKCLEIMAECNTKKDIQNSFPRLCNKLREYISKLPELETKWLVCTVRISKTEYKHDIAQRRALNQLHRKGISILPGQVLKYIHSDCGVILPSDYKNNPDISHYKKLLIRSLFVVLQPFGYSKRSIQDSIAAEKQTLLSDFLTKQGAMICQ